MVVPKEPLGFPTKNDQHLGWRWGVPPFKETPLWEIPPYRISPKNHHVGILWGENYPQRSRSENTSIFTMGTMLGATPNFP